MTGRSNTLRLIAVAVILGFLVFVALAYAAPDDVPLSPDNYGWNGLRGFYNSFGVTSLTSLYSLPATGAGNALLELQPTVAFSQPEVAEISRFVSSGGLLLVSANGDSPDANSLLSSLGVPVQIANDTVYDPLFNWGASNKVEAILSINQVPGLGGANISGSAQFLDLQSPSTLTLESTSVTVLAYSSPESHALSLKATAASNSQAATAAAGQSGPFPLVCVYAFGSGSVVVIGEPYFFTNSEWNAGANQHFLTSYLRGRQVMLDSSHWPRNTDASFRGAFAAFARWFVAYPGRYLLAGVFVLAGVCLVPAEEEKKSRKPFRRSLSPERLPPDLDKPEYERLLARVRKDRSG